MKISIIKIYDPNQDHEVGGLDVPFIVTARVEGATVEEAVNAVVEHRPLWAFNVRPDKQPDHIRFSTFVLERDIWKEIGKIGLMVLQSAAGFYLGTADEEGPVSRESAEYWPTEEAASRALAGQEGVDWTQRDYL